MNDNDSNPKPEDAGSVASEAAAAPAPKRARKSAAKPVAADDSVPAGVATEGVDAEAPKPRRRKAAAETADAAPAADPTLEAKPKRRTRKLAAEGVEAQASAPAEVAAVPQPLELSPSEPAAPVPEIDAGRQAADGIDGADVTDDGDGGGRRGRNRRQRGERRERAEDAMEPTVAAAPVDDGQLQAEAQARFDELLTGDFDAVADAAPEAQSAAVESAEELSSDDAQAESAGDEAGQASKRVLAAEPDAPKLQKVLAQAGVGSRRDIEDMIAKGQITVNGEVAHVGQRISFGDKVAVAGKPIKVRIAPPTPRILAYHKPVGEVVTFNDPEGRPTVFRNLPRLPQGKWQSVGRLDLNTEGLLLFTNSGELANQLMHPRFGVEREYAVRVLGSLSNEQKDKLLTGVEIEGQAASFKSITDGGGEGVNRWYRVVITEGRNREVRKLFESVGMAVSRLIRIRYGTVVLPRGLRRGVYVELNDADVRVIRQLAGHGDRERGERGDRGDRNDRNKRRRGGGNGGPRPSRPEPRQVEQRANDNRPPRQQQERERPRRDEHDEDDDDFIPRHINPLEQTFDRRFVGGGKSRAIPAGFGRGGSDAGRGGAGGGNRGGGKGKGGGGGGERQPDPMQTSVGYIGADAYLNRGGRGGGRRGGGGGGGGRGRR